MWQPQFEIIIRPSNRIRLARASSLEIPLEYMITMLPSFTLQIAVGHKERSFTCGHVYSVDVDA